MELEIKQNQNLKEFHTFGINVSSKYFIDIKTEDELKELLSNIDEIPKPYLILGSGSNMLFTKDYEGCIIKISIKGIKKVYENEKFATIEVKAGEIWDDFVDYTVNKNLYGIENLKLIPGTVGAAPVQNIGAYGMEVSDTIQRVNGFFVDGAKYEEISNRKSKFSYRNSIYKSEYKNNFIITSVVFKLKKKSELKLAYGSILNELKESEIKKPKPKDISRIVEKIRNSKLPDPEINGNAGSFFKNPIISIEKYKELQLRYPDLVSYKVSENKVKIAAGWLIDKLGWKGRSYGSAAVHDKQALVLINMKNASSEEVIQLSQYIIDDVNNIFGVELMPEVNFI